MAITNDAATGARWSAAGVDRIMIDLETYRKAERQKFRDTVKSNHSIADISAMRQALPDANIVARCEPVTMPRWGDHLKAVLDQQPTSVMLPMVETAVDVERLVDIVGQTANMIIMIETVAALADIDEIVREAPDATFFVGLNDLHIQLGQRFMFDPLANGQVDTIASVAQRFGAQLGFGGLARTGQGLVDSAAVVKEHVRLGSTLAILSRSFFGGLADALDVGEIRLEINKLRAVETDARLRDSVEQEADRRRTLENIQLVSERMSGTA